LRLPNEPATRRLFAREVGHEQFDRTIRAALRQLSAREVERITTARRRRLAHRARAREPALMRG
jgi:hypothetical protein